MGLLASFIFGFRWSSRAGSASSTRASLWSGRGARFLVNVISYVVLFFVLFCVCCIYLFLLEDWWVDQNGYSTWHVPRNLWKKAVRYTEWAQESLSGPICVEDLLGHFVSCLHYVFSPCCSNSVTEEDVAWAEKSGLATCCSEYVCCFVWSFAPFVFGLLDCSLWLQLVPEAFDFSQHCKSLLQQAAASFAQGMVVCICVCVASEPMQNFYFVYIIACRGEPNIDFLCLALLYQMAIPRLASVNHKAIPAWGLAIVNPIFQRRFLVSGFFILYTTRHCRVVKHLYKTSVYHLAILVVSPQWTKWRFLVSRLNEPNGDSTCLAIVNPTHMQEEKELSDATPSNEALHQRG